MKDPRWPELLDRHVESSIFHSSAWLKTLRYTYDYEPVAYSSNPPNQALTNAIVACRIRSRLTGPRLVSLPFSDHCQPLLDDGCDFQEVASAINELSEKSGDAYLELRCLTGTNLEDTLDGFHRRSLFYHHKISLQSSLDDLFVRLHKSCVQRKIGRAEKEGMICEAGRSEELLQDFYSLLIRTRRHHGLPPQPIQWFRHLIANIGDQLVIRVGYHQGRAVAAVLILHFKTSTLYKYGCSNPAFNSLGGMCLLLWKSIQEAQARGSLEFDLGRSDPQNKGLVTFKDRWGAKRETLITWRSSSPSRSFRFPDRWAHSIASVLPESILRRVGEFGYRHFG